MPQFADLRAAFVEGMSRAATFVAVATTDGEGGRAGVTVSSLTSVSADGEQPSLLVCINRQSPAATAILQNRAFCANLLAEDQQEIANLFAGRSATDREERFDQVTWAAGDIGQPMLAGATASFECRLATALLWETHHVIIGRVSAVQLSGSGSALLYGQRAYRRAIHLDVK
ncbi:MAG: flavin reductase family protein [Tabrizicola sp.]|uniref:flavin reductase family protein n=1 Tax=Tabrizicola sp. TaxID=2005166 RepID=UPI002AB97139|nr:flavin reductase family protein [Tabrizicola sp.]MDZ4089433.1 flavin reductase family protein [Tabrizicola sp.]